MKRLAVLLVALVLAAPLAAAPAESLVQVSRTADEITGVRIKVGILPIVLPVVERIKHLGSGTVIRSEGGRSWVLTCWHVCPNKFGECRVITPDADYRAEWVAVDDYADLALLVIKASLPAAELADEWPRPGKPVYIYGHEGGGPQVPRSGIAFVPGAREWVATPFGYLQIGPATDWIGPRPERGASGCAVLDVTGRVVGVVWGKNLRPDDPRGGLAVGLPDVRRFLAKHKPNK